MKPNKQQQQTVGTKSNETPASAGPQLVSTDRVPIPSSFTPVLLSLYHQQQSAAKQIEMLAARLKSLEQEAINAHGELTGLVKGIVISGGLDHNAVWDLSPDCTHLIKRQ